LALTVLGMAAAAVLLLGFRGEGQAAAAPRRMYVPQPYGLGPPLFKPPYAFQSADGADDWSIERWISYGGPTARAIAVADLNDCTPSCADGHHSLATTTIVFQGRVPCDGVLAYASFRVVRSTNAAVAAVGTGQDLTQSCGYAAFTASLPCLVHEDRAASVGAQQRCYESADRALTSEINNRVRSIARLLFTRTMRLSFARAERAWLRYRQAACTTKASTYAGGSYEPVISAACEFDLDEHHLSDLAVLRSAA
jgi:uncharacterized protein YecT (DUF1311 family)